MSTLPKDAETLEITPGTVIDGRYRVIRTIGQGGNGLVHEVEHLLTGRHLALKSLIDESGLARLEQEARASSLMKNARTVKITDMGRSGPAGPYLVMELLEGQSLRTLLDEAGQLPLELTVNIALQVCECLTEAHGLSIIHRDLKPDNIFLCSSSWPGQYDVKVLDFGIVKIASDGPIPQSSLTRTGSTVGTPYYMSLEQLRNSSAVDTRTDVYSLGVVMYECLSGRKPFTADTIGDLVYVLCSGPPTHIGRLRPDLPPELCEVIMRTLHANRDDRPASMLALATALLPYGNSNFGLWMKSEGKSSIAIPRPPSVGTPTPSGLSPVPGAFAKRAPMPSTTQIHPASTREPMPTATWPIPEEVAAPNVPLPAAGAPPPKPQRPEMDSEPGGRDTPTTMYIRDQHGPVDGPAPTERIGGRSEPLPTQALPDLLEEPSGDLMPTKPIDLKPFSSIVGRPPPAEEKRDTPTRAYVAGEMGATPEPDIGTQKTLLGQSGGPPLALPGVPSGPLPASAIRFGAPPLDMPMPRTGGPPTLNLATMPLPPLAELGVIPPETPPPAAPTKPSWQAELDLAGPRPNDKLKSAPSEKRMLLTIAVVTVLVTMLIVAIVLLFF